LASNFSTQRGTAIIVALFVMSLVATAAVAIMLRMRIDVQRTTLLLNANAAYLYAQGSIEWAKDSLADNWLQQKPNIPVDKMPLTSLLKEINGFKIQSTIYDAQANFNLNNLISSDYQPDFLQLLRTVAPTLESTQANRLAFAIHDWITPTANNKELSVYYEKATPPYRSPHRLMVSVSELRLVKGVTTELFNSLQPYITVLPATTPLNVNTTSPVVLMTLSSSFTPAIAQAIVLTRTQKPFTDAKKFFELDVVKNQQPTSIANEKITVTSNYFLVKTNVTVGQQQTILYTLLMRTIHDSKPTVVVLWQTKGTL
jgi:general secretion pathway protein K